MISGERVNPASSFPPALGPQLDELVGRFNGSDVFPVLVLIRDASAGFALFRWRHYDDAELETLATSTIHWPLTLTLVAADGAGTSLNIQERPRLQ